MNIIIKTLSMWRFFRLGIKHNSCPGNQTHFRIIGTTCANAECDDIDDINSPCESKNFNSTCNKENFASLNSKRFHKTLQSQENVALKLTEKRRNAYKKFETVDKIVLKESFQNQNYENIKKKNSGKRYSGSDLKLEKDLKLVVNNEEDIEDIEFGSLSEKTKESEFIPDEPDEKTVLEPRFLAHKYGRIMLALCKERKIKEALHILEVEMKNKDVAPDNYCYNILINACGKMGYAKKAFDLYYQMKSRGLKVEKFAYTGLFNACANSPFKLESLKLAVALRKQLKDNSVLLHPISYHAMIKAFGYCGDIKTAFEIVDDMVYDGHEITTETLNFLLHACVSDKETGFRHALMVWRKYRTLLISPDVYSYNLLIRCVNECGAGDPQLLSELFDDLKETSKLKGKLKKVQEKKFKRTKSHFLPISTSALPEPDQHVVEAKECDKDSRLKKAEESTEAFYQIGDKNEIVKVDLQPNMEMELVSPEKLKSKDSQELVLPNVLSYRVTPGNILAISSLEKIEDRFWLLGGVSGILKSMGEDRVKPSITTFINILDALPPTFEVEESLLETMENLKIKPNIIFCNKLIRKRCKRNCLEDAKDVLTYMQKHDIAVDLITFGCLSIGCRKPSDIRQFLRDMKENSITLNEEIMGSLVLNSVKSREYALAIELLGLGKRHEVPVTEYMLNLLEETRTTIKKKMIEIESEPPETVLSRHEKRVREEMKLFLMEYKHFLKKSCVELKEHPWAQFGYSEKSKQVSNRSSS